MLFRRPVGLTLVREIVAVYSLKHTYAILVNNQLDAQFYFRIYLF